MECGGNRKTGERKRKRRGMDSSFNLSLPSPRPLPVFSLRRPHYLSTRNRLVLPVLPRARIVPWVQEFHGLPLKKKKTTSFCFLFVACKQALHFEWRAERVASRSRATSHYIPRMESFLAGQLLCFPYQAKDVKKEWMVRTVELLHVLEYPGELIQRSTYICFGGKSLVSFHNKTS